MTLQEITKWLNDNQGLLTLILFFASLVLGWVSGIFRALIKKPKFKIRVVPKMTFCTVYLTGEKYTPPNQGTYDVHKTAFVVYLEITNVGSAPSNLGKTKIGYYKDDGKSTWFQKRLWIMESNVLADFAIPTGDGQSIRIPHLRYSNPQFDQTYNGFLEVGQSIIGAAYFEQLSSWGNNYPREKNGMVKIQVCVKDAFNNSYSKNATVPIKSLNEMLRYNPRFGFTQHLFDKDAVEDKIIEDKKENSGGTK
jgi:hypothetical protein